MKYILKLFLIWNFAIILVSILVQSIIPSRSRFVYSDKSESQVVKTLFWGRANFDGIHYTEIAKNGYGLREQAFFPLYPHILSFLSRIYRGVPLYAGIIVSTTSTLVALYFLYRLVLLDFSVETARKTLLWWLIFPTSFFLGMVYTEGLFIALLLGSFLAARKQNWLIAGVLGGLAAHTRIVGICIFPALLYEFYEYRKKYCQIPRFGISFSSKVGRFLRKSYCLIQPAVTYWPLFIIPWGLFSYMNYLRVVYNDPLKFVHVQPEFGAQRTGDHIILYYQVVWRYLKMILTTSLDPLYIAVWAEFIFSSLALALLYLGYRRKIRASYLIYAAGAYIIPTLTGTFSSVPRYILSLFPLFILAALYKNPKISRVVQIIFGAIFILFCGMFLRGYWVA